MPRSSRADGTRCRAAGRATSGALPVSGQDLAEEQLGPFGLRIVEELGRRSLCSTISPRSMKITRSATVAGEAHLVRDAEHGHAVVGELDHDVQHFLDHLGVECRCRLVEQHDLRASCTASGRSPRAAAARRRAGRDICSPARGCAPASGSSSPAPRPAPWASCAPRSAPACSSPARSGAGTG